ncbi:uncharacterized protein LOC18432812 isoform X2 [Amborella trichopoda]|uniref:uncharacterized protein LOC18432812 isoform X2 n=1 Tax=Amborella trichopoda TaxID=13333 RepID=UPI0009BE9B9D|nr:uncharacterized protein LOC18432812 isoform X2 [Amborella trichopoda]|eukprot:XP_020522043.1 uncharacterized protein LOC18432812 isoform X2 [Amborella trichopoda]
MHVVKVRWVGQTFALAACDASHVKKPRKRRTREERKLMIESFIEKIIFRYRNSKNGNFPSLTLTHKEVGGSFYTIRDIIREIVQEKNMMSSSSSSSKESDISNGKESELDSLPIESQFLMSLSGEKGQLKGQDQGEVPPIHSSGSQCVNEEVLMTTSDHSIDANFMGVESLSHITSSSQSRLIEEPNGDYRSCAKMHQNSANNGSLEQSFTREEYDLGITSEHVSQQKALTRVIETAHLDSDGVIKDLDGAKDSMESSIVRAGNVINEMVVIESLPEAQSLVSAGSTDNFATACDEAVQVEVREDFSLSHSIKIPDLRSYSSSDETDRVPGIRAMRETHQNQCLMSTGNSDNLATAWDQAVQVEVKEDFSLTSSVYTPNLKSDSSSDKTDGLPGVREMLEMHQNQWSVRMENNANFSTARGQAVKLEVTDDILLTSSVKIPGQRSYSSSDETENESGAGEMLETRSVVEEDARESLASLSAKNEIEESVTSNSYSGQNILGSSGDLSFSFDTCEKENAYLGLSKTTEIPQKSLTSSNVADNSVASESNNSRMGKDLQVILSSDDNSDSKKPDQNQLLTNLQATHRLFMHWIAMLALRILGLLQPARARNTMKVGDETNKIPQSSAMQTNGICGQVDPMNDTSKAEESYAIFDEIHSVSFDGSFGDVTKPERNPIWELVKAFINAFIRFWSE